LSKATFASRPCIAAWPMAAGVVVRMATAIRSDVMG
jgi:hypothetical protein